MLARIIHLLYVLHEHFIGIRVRFTHNQFDGSEAAESVFVSLELVGGTSASSFSVTVTPSIQSPVSAKSKMFNCTINFCVEGNVLLSGGVDFNSTTLIATFTSGVTMTNVTIPVLKDNIVELPEHFDLSLNVPSSLGPAITADSGKSRAVGVIIDSTSKKVIIIL